MYSLQTNQFGEITIEKGIKAIKGYWVRFVGTYQQCTNKQREFEQTYQ